MSPSSKKQPAGSRFRRVEPASFSVADSAEDVRTFFETSPAGEEVRSWSLLAFTDDAFETSPLIGDVLGAKSQGATTGADSDSESSSDLLDKGDVGAESDTGQEVSSDEAGGESSSQTPTEDADAASQGEPVEAASSEAPAEQSAAEQLEVAIAQAVDEALETQKEALKNEVHGPYLESVRVLEKATEKLNTLMTERAVELAHRLAEALVRREVGVEPKIILENLEHAIEVAGPMTEVVVDCHPHEVDFLRQAAPSIFEEKLGRAVELSFSPTSSLESGDLVIRFEEGMVDAKWETQLQRLTDVLRETPLQSPDDSDEKDEIASEGQGDEDTSDTTELTHEHETEET